MHYSIVLVYRICRCCRIVIVVTLVTLYKLPIALSAQCSCMWHIGLFYACNTFCIKFSACIYLWRLMLHCMIRRSRALASRKTRVRDVTPTRLSFVVPCQRDETPLLCFCSPHNPSPLLYEFTRNRLQCH